MLCKICGIDQTEVADMQIFLKSNVTRLKGIEKVNPNYCFF